MTGLDTVISKCVDDIWDKFDTDKSGALDRSETKEFIKKALHNIEENESFSEEDFDACFKEFDRDGSGLIEKEEMTHFIMKIAGLEETR